MGKRGSSPVEKVYITLNTPPQLINTINKKYQYLQMELTDPNGLLEFLGGRDGIPRPFHLVHDKQHIIKPKGCSQLPTSQPCLSGIDF